jgi:hypothetical protein
MVKIVEMSSNSGEPEGLPADEPDPFELLETAGAVVAFIWNKAGEAGLRDLLGRDVEGKPLNREWVEDVAAELEAAGMMRASAIVSEIASQKPSELDVETYCPYPRTPENETNIWSWLQAAQNRQRQQLKRRK